MIYYREYQRGLVVVNPTQTARAARIPLGMVRRCRNVFTGQDTEGESLMLQLPAESGRVFLWK